MVYVRRKLVSHSFSALMGILLEAYSEHGPLISTCEGLEYLTIPARVSRFNLAVALS